MTNGLDVLPDAARLPASGGGAGSLRIGVNLVPLASDGGGMRQYVLQLLPWLLRLSAHRLLLFCHWQSQPSVAAMLRRLSPAERNRVRTVLLDDQERIFAHAAEFDVYFCPLCALVPDLLDRPTLATIPDIQERFFPQYFSDEQRYLRGYYYPYTAHAVTTLLTLSDFSKRTIGDAFGVPPARVRAIHLAPNDEIVDAPSEWPAQLGPLPPRYVFYPANLYPHKNHKVLLRALALLNRERGIDCACLLTGQPSRPGIDIHQEIAAHGLTDRVRWLGHVTAGTLRHLYEHAVALCFPSEFEGFGMPLVEAMLCGCPVIATPAASIPEIVGDAALLIDGTPEAFADAIARLLSDPSARRDPIERGRAHAQRFDVRRLADQTLQALEEAVARFWEPRSSPPGVQTISFVVQPVRGSRPLVETLARLAFEVHDHDEVLMLAVPDALCPEARTLCGNLRVVRYLGPADGPDAWLDEVRNDCVCFLREGDWISEGAARVALAAFAERPDSAAVVGQALARDSAGNLAGVRYLPPRCWLLERQDVLAAATPSWWRRFGLGREGDPPCTAVFWRLAHLQAHRRLLAGSSWSAELLARAGSRAVVRYRTFASVPAEGSPALPRTVSTVRRVARSLPGWLRRPLRGLYRRMLGVCPLRGEPSRDRQGAWAEGLATTAP